MSEVFVEFHLFLIFLASLDTWVFDFEKKSKAKSMRLNLRGAQIPHPEDFADPAT